MTEVAQGFTDALARIADLELIARIIVGGANVPELARLRTC